MPFNNNSSAACCLFYAECGGVMIHWRRAGLTLHVIGLYITSLMRTVAVLLLVYCCTCQLFSSPLWSHCQHVCMQLSEVNDFTLSSNIGSVRRCVSMYIILYINIWWLEVSTCHQSTHVYPALPIVLAILDRIIYCNVSQISNMITNIQSCFISLACTIDLQIYIRQQNYPALIGWNSQKVHS